jgi:hypothetical protein
VITGLAAALPAGDPAGDLGAEADAGCGAGGAGLTPEVLGGAVFGVCVFGAGVAAEVAWLAGATLAPVAGLAGAG